MKIYFLVALLLVAFAAIMAAPAEHETDSFEPLTDVDQDDAKLKLSCNLGDGVCAIHCVTIGKHGGRCKEGVCHCIQ